jgi:hypothetical protein
MPEVVLVARSKGVSIPDDYGDDRMKFAASSSQTFKSYCCTTSNAAIVAGKASCIA